MAQIDELRTEASEKVAPVIDVAQDANFVELFADSHNNVIGVNCS